MSRGQRVLLWLAALAGLIMTFGVIGDASRYAYPFAAAFNRLLLTLAFTVLMAYLAMRK